jgi:hypothetical protein
MSLEGEAAHGDTLYTNLAILFSICASSICMGCVYTRALVGQSKRSSSNSNKEPTPKHLSDGLRGLLASSRFQFTAIVGAGAYHLFETWHLAALSDSIWQPRPVLAVGLLVAAAAHFFVHPRTAARVGCCVLLTVVGHRCCAAFMVPLHVLHAEADLFERPHGLHVLWVIAGAILGRNSHLPHRDRFLTFTLINAIVLVRMNQYRLRTGSQEGVPHVLLYTCLPFCASFLVARSPTAARLFGWPKPRMWQPHDATPVHVDSLCAHCGSFFATVVLRPCGLGLCPECLHQTDRWEDANAKGVICPRCGELANRWDTIRHCDLEDEKEL